MPARLLNVGPLVDIVPSHTPPKLRLAINQFVLAYGRETFATLCATVFRNRSDLISIRIYDQDWGQILTDRDCPTFERALQLGERFFDTPRDGWVLAPSEIESWREPVAREFENRRSILLICFDPPVRRMSSDDALQRTRPGGTVPGDSDGLAPGRPLNAGRLSRYD